MISALGRRFFGTPNDRLIKNHFKTVEAINALEPEIAAMSDQALRARTDDLRRRVADGTPLDALLVETFAVVREAARRTLGQRHFDVQLVGGMVLHDGKIAEMKTGEGKTLVATLPVCLNALTGKGVHVVTVNDYLARRDAAWMGQIYQFLGLSVGCIVHGLTEDERRRAYAADVTYGTNNEFGFDYLRDNMKFTLSAMVHRPFQFAIVDEVDSILIDEARVPLIISGPSEDHSELYAKVDRIIPMLTPDDYEKDEKSRNVTLTESGTEHIESLMQEAGLLKSPSLYDIENVNIVHHVNVALRAHKLFQRDTEYIVKDGKIVLVDEFTGRMMEGRRYSEGQHQAIEAKEGVNIQGENQTYATITFQNYFRMYPKLAGMTGTAMTEASEFGDIYGLSVVEVPTHQPMIRIDHDDEIYRSVEEKQVSVVAQIEACRKQQQPILVGTTSIDKSEQLSERLKKKGIPHNVLNARYHEQEAHIIAQAGRVGAVTIATNMAGRGTDIQLGGNLEMRLADELKDVTDETERAKLAERIRAEVAREHDAVVTAGGLFVLGTERHESRRIDNQLRGRSGRQGDPGGSRFYLSLQDDLMRIFGSERLDSMLRRLGLGEGEAIFHPWINKALEKAQQKVEARNFDARRNLLRFDNVMNDQRKLIYAERRELMGASSVAEEVLGAREQIIDELVARYVPEKAYVEQWQIGPLHDEVKRVFGLDLAIADWAKEEGIAEAEITERIKDAVNRHMAEKAVRFGLEVMRAIEKDVMVQVLDQQWREHLLSLDHLRQGIYLRGFAQKDPFLEYRREAFNLFDAMLARFRETVTMLLAHVEARPAPIASAPAPQIRERIPEMAGADPYGSAATGFEPVAGTDNAPANWGKIGRNEPCPCGSGKKYKHCHGKVA